MRCTDHCPAGNSGLAAAVAVVAVAAGVAAVAEDVIVAAAVVVTVLVAAGLSLLGWLLWRDRGGLYAPVRAAVPRAGQVPAVGAGRQRALGTPRRDAVISGLVLRDEGEVPR